MSIVDKAISKMTVAPLLYLCGALLLLVIGLGVKVAMLGSDLDAAVANQGKAEAERDAVITEREAWKGRADELQAANGAYGTALNTMHQQLQMCQGEAARIESEGLKAVAAARAEAADADAALKRFTAQFQAESRKPVCAAALAALDAACPALQGY